MYKKGFTLIELLVVIAIIGILSGVVLTSLNTARGKASDSAIKADLANMRAQAEVLYDDSGNYNGVCENNIVIQAIAGAQKANGGTAPTCLDGNSNDVTGDSWAISSPLKTDSNVFWCVDYTGASKETTAAAAVTGGVAVCP